MSLPLPNALETVPLTLPDYGEEQREQDEVQENVLPLIISRRQIRHYRSRLLQRHARCIYCDCELTEETATIEHAIPKSNGGTNAPANLFLACGPCNNERQSRDLLKWAVELRAHAAKLMARADRLEQGFRKMFEMPEPDDSEEFEERVSIPMSSGIRKFC